MIMQGVFSLLDATQDSLLLFSLQILEVRFIFTTISLSM